MGILSSEWDGRIGHWIRTLKDDFYEPLGRIELEAFRTDRHLSYEEAQAAAFMPVSPGFAWGKAWEYCWFRGDVLLPAEASGKRIVLDLKTDGESALFVNGQEFGTYRASWVAERHHYLVDNTIASHAQAGSSYHIVMETYAGHDYPNRDCCATGPVLPGSYEGGENEGSRRRLGESTFGIWHEEAYQLYMDVAALWHLLRQIDQDSLRASKIAAALKQFTKDVDFEQERSARIADYQKARENLKGVLSAENGPTMPLFWAVGNAHLDLAWLWPVAETKRKTLRTFAAQLRLLEEYPDYCYIQSQPAAYEICRLHYPALFRRIQEAVKEGRWIADGAMWVEPDTNMAGGEALIRQILHGKRYFKEMFGIDSRVLWLPDSFGYTAALPQILMGCDVPYLVTQKIFWSYNEGERFPYHYFYWEGLDGTKVTSFLPTSYTYQTDPEEIGKVWKERMQKESLEAFLLPFGYGDGGGGPTRDHIEYALRQKDLEGSPRMKMGSPEEFFRWMEQQGGPKDTYVGEMYFSAHRGTYTSQAGIKQDNRRSELALREMEIWGSVAAAAGFRYELSLAGRLWKTLLFHQFHDILPGSSIERVYQEAAIAHKDLQQEARRMTGQAVEFLEKEEDGLCFFNSLSWEREALVELPEEYENGAATWEGIRIPVQKSGGRILAMLSIPSCGAVSLRPSLPDAKEGFPDGREIPQVLAWQDEKGYHMENEHVSALVGQDGLLVSFVLKCSGREMAAGAMNRLLLYKDQPRAFDAWDIDSNYREEEPEEAQIGAITLSACGVEAVLQIKGIIGKSSYVQEIRLKAGSKRLEFETQVDWKELHRLLKTSFPVAVHTANARHEMQFGYVERPVHRSKPYDRDRFEVCNHRYTALCDEAHGAALLNCCKYGISVNGNDMELTLLRASASPHMKADNGLQQFGYALYAWEGSFIESDVVRQGYEFNVMPYMAKGSLPAFCAVQIDKKDVILETMKPAEDNSGDLVLRLYEAAGAAVAAEAKIHLPARQIWACNMLEEKQEILLEAREGEVVLKLPFRAFEIKTLRLSLQ